MQYDYLVESPCQQSFHLVPRTDGRIGLASVVAMDCLPELWAEADLEQSFVAQYSSQLALHGAVDRDLLLMEGRTIVEELDRLYEKIKKTEIEAETGFKHDVTLMGPELSEGEIIWATLQGYRELLVLDRNGYADLLLSPFTIDQPEVPQGSFIQPMSVCSPFVGLVEAVHAVAELRDNPRAAYCMQQRIITRDMEERAVHVSDEEYLTVGWLDRHDQFLAYATLSEPFRNRS